MGKKSRRKRELRESRQKGALTDPLGSLSWQDIGGVHFLSPGIAPSAEIVTEMTKNYQQQLRKSPLWDEWVKQFGLEMAEELLKECQVKIKPG